MNAESFSSRRRNLEKGLVYEAPKGEPLRADELTTAHYFFENGQKRYIKAVIPSSNDETTIVYSGGSRTVESSFKIEAFKKSPEEMEL